MAGLKDACWKGYEAYGTKTKNGRTVPNCVPKSGKGIPNAQERAAFDIPLARWANAMGKGGVEVRVPTAEQETRYSCGPAALRSALSGFGIGAEEDKLAELARTSASDGTSVYGLLHAAKESGVDAKIAHGMTVDKLMDAMENGQVVVVCIQAGDDIDEYKSSHWTVPTAIKPGAEGIEIEVVDPMKPNVHAVMHLDEFEDRWHCLDMGKKINGLGLVLTAKESASGEAIERPKMPM